MRDIENDLSNLSKWCSESIMVQKWTCSGVSKDGQQHSNQFSPGSHEPQENYGDDCVMCGLTREQVVGGGSKPLGKLIAIPIVAGIVAALGIGSWAVLERSKPSLSPSISETGPSPSSASPEPTVPPAKIESRCGTDKFVKKSGNLFGAIEVGSKGIKGKVIQELETSNEDGTKLVLFRKEKIEDRNVTAIEPDSKSATVESVKDVFMEIQKRFNIPCEQIVVYGSSGLDQVPHKTILAQEVQQATGRAMEFITPETEANLVFDGVVPEWRRSEVISIDIGSGNTKGAFLTSDNQHVTFRIPFGTVTFTKKAEEIKGTSSFQEAAENAKKEFTQLINNEIQLKPGMQNSPRVYLAGGIAWALSTLVRPCSKEYSVTGKREERFDSFVPIRSEDIATFYNNATQAPKALYEPNLGECSDERRAEVLKDIEKIKQDPSSGKPTFTLDNLIAGAEILRAFDKELGFSGKQVFFARSSKDALPIGYIKKQLDNIEKGDGR